MRPVGRSVRRAWIPALLAAVLGALWPVACTSVDNLVSPSCTFAMSPSSASYGGSGGTGSFDVTAGDVCTWSVQTSASSITITSGASGKGNGHVGYTVLANSVTSARSAAVTIGSTDFSVSQAPISVNCSFAVSPTFSSFPGDGGSGDVSVGGPAGCPWSATPTVNWITVTNGATGSGNGNVSFTVAPNGGSATREGAITVAGQTVGVSEAAPAPPPPNCTFAASPPSASYDATGGNGTVAVAAANNCAWSATAGATWITVTGGAVGTGNGTVQYSVAANTTGAARTAALTVAGITVTITQAAPCAFTVTPTSATYVAAGGTGTITVTTTAGCAWTATETATWITITAGASGTDPVSCRTSSRSTAPTRIVRRRSRWRAWTWRSQRRLPSIQPSQMQPRPRLAVIGPTRASAGARTMEVVCRRREATRSHRCVRVRDLPRVQERSVFTDRRIN